MDYLRHFVVIDDGSGRHLFNANEKCWWLEVNLISVTVRKMKKLARNSVRHDKIINTIEYTW